MKVAVMMTVMVAVVISTGSFIQGFSTIAVLLTLMLRTSSSTDSSTSTTQIAVEYDEVDGGGKLVEKSSKSQRIVKESKSFKGLKNLQRPSVPRNVYQSTDPPSIRYKEFELPLEL